jgi:predicted amidohydrolase
MERRVKIAGLQMLVTGNVSDNEGRIAEGLQRAAADEADFLLTPEGSLSGYYAGFDGEEVAAGTARLAERARELGVGLALGTCYKEEDGDSEYCYNQVRLYAKDGEYLGYHAKMLRCSSLEYPGTGEMRDYVEGALRTFEWHGVRFGALICNDLWATPRWTTIPNPYLPWKLKQMGAQFMLHAITSGRDQRHRAFHESSTELWARALQLPIVQVNAAPADGGPVNAPSGALDADGVRSVEVADCGEQYFLCDLPIAERAPEPN